MDQPASYDQLYSLLKARHSCRGFLSEPVEQTSIEAVVRAAQRVPSWCNAQPWQVIITRAGETERFRQALEAAAKTENMRPDVAFPRKYAGIYKDRRRACGWQLYDAVGVEKGDHAASARQMSENFRLFGAPHMALVTSEADLGAYGVLDCGAFVAAFTIAATSLGVASIPQAAVAGFSDLAHTHFDLPATRQVLCAISFGYEDETHAANKFRTPRAPLGNVIDWR